MVNTDNIEKWFIITTKAVKVQIVLDIRDVCRRYIFLLEEYFQEELKEVHKCYSIDICMKSEKG